MDYFEINQLVRATINGRVYLGRYLGTYGDGSKYLGWAQTDKWEGWGGPGRSAAVLSLIMNRKERRRLEKAQIGGIIKDATNIGDTLHYLGDPDIALGFYRRLTAVSPLEELLLATGKDSEL